MTENKGEQPEQERGSVWLKELIDIRNRLYDLLPTGQVKSFDLMTTIKWHVNDLDNLCSRIAATQSTGINECETCRGEGSVEKNIQRDGYPEKDVPVVCSDCGGTGKAAAQPSKVQEKEIEELKAWKESAISVMPDMQAIGKALNVPLGQSVHDKILPGIEKLKGSIIRALNMTTMTWSEKKDFLKSNNL